MNDKITKAQSDCALTDKDIISDVLACQKNLVSLYATSLCEISCEELRGIVSAKLCECAQDQFDMFDYMSCHDMYPTKQADEQQMCACKDKYQCECKRIEEK